MVHRREVNGQAIVFGNQGDLWRNAMTLFDHETGSIWTQPTAEAILGERTGESLELLPSTLSTWADWKAQHPDTIALDVMTVSSGVRLGQLVVAASVNGEAVAVPFRDLRDAGAYSTVIAGEPVLFVADQDVDQWAVYSRVIDGDERALELRDGVVFDPASGYRWSPALGSSIDGQAPLDRIPSFSSFAKDFENHFPDGELVDLK